MKRLPGRHVQKRSDRVQAEKRQQTALRRRALAEKPPIDRKRGRVS
jgi:hypothetical protein